MSRRSKRDPIWTNCLHEYLFCLERQAHGKSEDPDQTSNECDIYCKDRQLLTPNIPTVYPTCSE